MSFFFYNLNYITEYDNQIKNKITIYLLHVFVEEDKQVGMTALAPSVQNSAEIRSPQNYEYKISRLNFKMTIQNELGPLLSRK